MDPVPGPLLLRKSGSAGDRTRDLCICSQKLWPLDHICRYTTTIKWRARACSSSVLQAVRPTRCQKGRNNRYIAYIQTLYDVGSSYVPEDPSLVRILHNLELGRHVVNYVCVYNGIHFKSKRHHSETWSSGSMSVPPLVLSPNSILPLLLLIALFIYARENRRAFQISFCVGLYYRF